MKKKKISLVDELIDRLSGTDLTKKAKRAEKLLDSAQFKKEAIIREAEEKATEIINQSNFFTQDLQKKYEDKLDQSVIIWQKKLEGKADLALGEIISQIKDEMLVRSQQEVDAYRQLQYQLIDEKVETMVADLAIKVLKKTLSRSDQEKFVMQALKEAKAKGFFD